MPCSATKPSTLDVYFYIEKFCERFSIDHQSSVRKDNNVVPATCRLLKNFTSVVPFKPPKNTESEVKIDYFDDAVDFDEGGAGVCKLRQAERRGRTGGVEGGQVEPEERPGRPGQAVGQADCAHREVEHHQGESGSPGQRHQDYPGHVQVYLHNKYIHILYCRTCDKCSHYCSRHVSVFKTDHHPGHHEGEHDDASE